MNKKSFFPRPVLVGGVILLLFGLFRLLSDEYVAMGGNTSFAGIKEEISIEERYPSYAPLKFQRDQFDLTPEHLGETLVPLGVIGFNPWDESGTTKYNLGFEFRIDSLGFPIQFYGDTLEFDGTNFSYFAENLEDASGAYLVLTSKEEPVITASYSGIPLRVLFLWNTPIKDTTLYVYRLEEPTGAVLNNLSITSTKESILWAITLVKGREIVENEFHMQNVLPDTTVSTALATLSTTEDMKLYFGNKVTVEGIPFILTSYHFAQGSAFVPKSSTEIWLLVTWQGTTAPIIHSASGAIAGQTITWSTQIGDSGTSLGILHTPAIDGTYYLENAQDVLGITTK